jgi:cytoskeletal protein CcmA (bactofilin family)
MEPTNKEMATGQAAPPASPNSSTRTSSYLSAGLHIKGEISGNEDLRLESKVEGLISIGGFRLTVGPGAHLDADIVAREAVISGEVNGDIRAVDRIEIKKSASIVGELTTGKIMIEEGAYFKGGIEIGEPGKQIGTDLDSLLNQAKKV